jgi:hypothetical protein
MCHLCVHLYLPIFSGSEVFTILQLVLSVWKKTSLSKSGYSQSQRLVLNQEFNCQELFKHINLFVWSASLAFLFLYPGGRQRNDEMHCSCWPGIRPISDLSGTQESFICTFSLLISLSFTFQSSKFRNHFTISSKYFDMVCYLKQEASSPPISFEVKQNDSWTDNIQSFELPF